MNGRRARWWLAVAVLVGGVAAAATLWWWHETARERAVVAASLPPGPDLSGLSADLLQRINGCEQRARTGPGRTAALAELSRLYHANGFLAEASRCYEGLLQVDSTNPLWPHRLANIVAGYGDLDEAMPLLRRAVALAPAYGPARLRLGDALLKMNQNAEAAKVYGAVLEREPGNPYALLGLARLDVDAGRWAEARTRLESVVAQTKYTVGYDLLPTVYEHLGQPDRAVAIRARMKASGAFADMLDPWMDELIDDCYSTYRLSVAAGTAQHRGDTKGAINLLQRAISLAPDSGPLQFQIGLIYFEQRNYTNARQHLERCTVLTPDFPDGWAYLTKLYTTVGDATSARRVLAGGLARCPRSPGLRLEYGRQLSAAGQFAEAIPELEESIQLRPEEADAYVELAKVYFQLNRVDEGVAELHRALQVEPEHPTALTTLALYSISTGDETAARAWLRRVQLQVRTQPETVDALLRAFTQRFGKAPW
jgi:tetratricopeptide (TPR) repeat protein